MTEKNGRGAEIRTRDLLLRILRAGAQESAKRWHRGHRRFDEGAGKRRMRQRMVTQMVTFARPARRTRSRWLDQEKQGATVGRALFVTERTLWETPTGGTPNWSESPPPRRSGHPTSPLRSGPTCPGTQSANRPATSRHGDRERHLGRRIGEARMAGDRYRLRAEGPCPTPRPTASSRAAIPQ